MMSPSPMPASSLLNTFVYRMSCWKPKADHEDIKPPDDIEKLFKDPKYTNGSVMSLEQFRDFLREFQGEDDKTLVDVENMFQAADITRIKLQKGLLLRDFFAYLFSDPNHPLPKQVHQDMNAPLAHYFIHTRVKIGVFSTGKGRLGTSKLKRNIAAIREALKMGVRLIQLDLSNATNKNTNGRINNINSSEDVVIRWTLRQYMEAIKECAFNSGSVYPVILAFEGDFDSKIQSHVAELAKTIFVGMLHDPKLEPQKLLSPQNLLNKILLAQPELMEKQECIPKCLRSSTNGNTSNMKLENAENKEYKSLVAISYLRRTQQNLEHAVKIHEAQVVEFTKKNLLMVYPVDKLSGSKNCNPLTGWSLGAQMIASNLQGCDKYLGVMQGMFRDNGGCGYVKKPEMLLKQDVDYEIFNPKTTLEPKTTLKVKIYMGDGWHLDFSAIKFDLLSPPDFFLKVQVFGVAADCTKEETDLEEDQWRPRWDKEFNFPLIAPQLAMLRIEARDLDENMSQDFGGQTCLPVAKLKRGIRTVPLYNKKGRIYDHVRLLVAFDFIHH
ncbi:hypothetical protein V2J09_017077 [Rumex salicifolius]